MTASLAGVCHVLQKRRDRDNPRFKELASVLKQMLRKLQNANAKLDEAAKLAARW